MVVYFIQHYFVSHMNFLLLQCEAHIKYCNYGGKSSVAGTHSTHMVSLQSFIIWKLLHYTGTNLIFYGSQKNYIFLYSVMCPNFRTHYNCISLKICFHMTTIWFFKLLYYEPYKKCCNFGGKSSEAGTHSTCLLSLKCCVIWKSFHCNRRKTCIKL